MRVLVTGGTGFVGTAVCDELAARGHEVKALARNPGEADFEGDVETVRGDVTDYDSIEAHFSGLDAVVNLVALSPLFRPRGGEERHFTVHLGGTKNVVAAAETHGVDRLVQMSGIGADPDAKTAYLRAKGQAETVVKNASPDWVVFRPSVLFEDGCEIVSFTKTVAPPYLTPLPGGGKTRFQLLWLGDLAPMVADAVTGTVTGPSADQIGDTEGGEANTADSEDADSSGDEPTSTGDGGDPHTGHTYELGGPEILTLAEIARLAHAADGKPVTVIPIPMSLTKLGFSMLDIAPGAPFGTNQYHGLVQDHVTTRNAISSFGYRPEDLTSFQAYLGVSEEDVGDLTR